MFECYFGSRRRAARCNLCSLLLVLAGLALGTIGPARVGRAGFISPVRADMDSEVKMGKEAEAQISKTSKFVTDPAVVQRVQSIFSRLASVADTVQVPAGFGNDEVYKFDYRVRIIDQKEVNAFSLPGGAIYIYKGLLDLLHGDDEVAAVLGHEIAHAAHHHVAELTHEQHTMTTQMALGVLVALLAKVPAETIGGLATEAEYAQMARLNNHFSEAAEKDADHTGMVYMVKAGFNPIGMLALLQTLQDVEDRSPSEDLGFLQDHPLTPERLTAADNELQELGYKLDPAMLWKVSELHANSCDGRAVERQACCQGEFWKSLDRDHMSGQPFGGIGGGDRFGQVIDEQRSGLPGEVCGLGRLCRWPGNLEFHRRRRIHSTYQDDSPGDGPGGR